MVSVPRGGKSRETPDKRMIISKKILYQKRPNGFPAESPAGLTGRDLLLQILRGNYLLLLMLLFCPIRF